MEKLTEREKKVLYLIRLIQFERGYSPSSEEMAQIFCVHRSFIKGCIKGLVKKGYIEMKKGAWQHRVILFPKGLQFPWGDMSQFPQDVFTPLESQYKYDDIYRKPDPSPEPDSPGLPPGEDSGLRTIQ